ncbi:MAG TPA: hypothetical protein VF817_00515 [Patescibacteria group bacterium]
MKVPGLVITAVLLLIGICILPIGSDGFADFHSVRGACSAIFLALGFFFGVIASIKSYKEESAPAQHS